MRWGLAMCGICGWVDHDRNLGTPDARRELDAMTATMACRGPDDEGTWVDGPVALGHRRLAVIDVPGGRQPMTLRRAGRRARARLQRRDLQLPRAAGATRCRGHRFTTSSDTEVVLHAHQEWGDRDPRDAVRELNGMFAYALWDTRDPRARAGPGPAGGQAAVLLPHPARRAVRLGAQGDPGQRRRRAGGRRRRAAARAGVRRRSGQRGVPRHAGGAARLRRAGQPRRDPRELRYWALEDTGPHRRRPDHRRGTSGSCSTTPRSASSSPTCRCARCCPAGSTPPP